MPRRRSPARWLAPLALVAAVLAVYLVANPGSDSSSNAGGSAATGTTSTSAKPRTTTAKSTTVKAKPKTYTVQAGDVLSTIAEKNGITLSRLQELNPDADANALRTGQKLKLAPSS